MTLETSNLDNIEKGRLEALERYEILDTQPDQSFDHIAKVASTLCETPIALISLIDSDRQWFKSCIGVEVDEAARNVSFCTHTIAEADGLMEVPDTLTDARFENNPFVTGPPHIRFYAGASITTNDGYHIGTLCVMDYIPRSLTNIQSKSLAELAKALVSILENSLTQREHNKLIKKAVRANAHEINNFLTIALARIDSDTNVRQEIRTSVTSTINNISSSLKKLTLQFNQAPKFAENIELSSPNSIAHQKEQTEQQNNQAGEHQHERHATAQELNHKLSALTQNLNNHSSDVINQNSFSLPKLLIAEDDTELGNILKRMLSEDFDVLVCTDGEAAQKSIDEFQPDIVLLDWMLPKIKGIELCKYVKSNPTLRYTKVLLLTALQDDDSKLAALNSGADDFLSKPISSLELKTRLSNIKTTIKLEKELKNQNQQLSVALDNLKSTESQLIHSAKLGAIGSLAAGLLHEVNNPLNYVMTAVQLLSREKEVTESEDLNELTTDIKDGIDRIKLIVKDLHTFAYPSEIITGESFVLAHAINSALRFTSSTLRDIKIDNKADQNIMVKGSKSHIVQVMVNLLSNAGSALSETESKEIAISTRITHPLSNNESNGAQKIIVEFKDNGCGISKQELERVFEPFYTSKEVGDGLGMGLSISNTIIKNHGGALQISSEEGSYTSCTFDLNVVSHAIAN